ncbi:unnamed protein product [Coregonus sp. 'balchen']|nr:unnamed protein product [Coregonus sp. 'balchen']
MHLVRDRVTRFSKGYAFDEYKEERSVVRASRDANKLVVDQSELFVDFGQEKTPKGWIAHRLGRWAGGQEGVWSDAVRWEGQTLPQTHHTFLPP